jgi:hypothetical protein
MNEVGVVTSRWRCAYRPHTRRSPRAKCAVDGFRGPVRDSKEEVDRLAESRGADRGGLT